MAHPVPRYAKSLVSTMRADAAAEKGRTNPHVDTAEVVSLKGGVQISPSNTDIVYEEDDILWNIDPDGLKVGDTVTLLRDPDENPIVIGLVDGMQPDPSLHPTHIRLKNEFDRLKANAVTWKGPVQTFDLLPTTGNRQGDVRLVLGENKLYRWRAGNAEWVVLSGTGGGASELDDLVDVLLTSPQVGDILYFDGSQWVNASLAGLIPDIYVDTSGDTMTGSLVMTTGTYITLPDAPVNPTDAVNKAYVDAAIAAAISGIVLVPTVVVTTSSYNVTANDQAILVNQCAGPTSIVLPANHIATKIYEIKDIGGCSSINNITITSADGDLIDGLASAVISTDWTSISVVSDGTDWYIF